jgi:hypothetical protein
MKATKTIKVANATNEQLDWLVAICEGYVDDNDPSEHTGPDEALCYHNWLMTPPAGDHRFEAWLCRLNYSTNWLLMGPIIEREGASVVRCEDAYGEDERGFATSRRIPVWGAVIGRNSSSSIYGSQGDNWGRAYTLDEDALAYGPTPLIAAARCYVTSKLGDTVEAPECLA